MPVFDTIDIFKALSDDVRLRIVNALMSAELSVAELVDVLGLPQSTVSRHLKPLRDCQLVDTRREGTSIYYRKGPGLLDADLAKVLKRELARLNSAKKDEAALKRVLERRKQRSRDYFDKVAGQYGELTQPGGGWPALAAGMAAGFSGRDVADLGSGEGDLVLLLARYARTVTAVDQSKAMLREVSSKAAALGLGDIVKVREGDLEHLPVEDGSMDAVFLSQALHHAAQPEKALAEAARILKPGGMLVLLDLDSHDQDWVREQWADQWLGFDEGELRAWFSSCGLRDITCEKLTAASPDFSVLLATAKK